MGKIIDHNNFWYIEKNPISKTGVFPYLGREIGYPGLEPNKIYYVLRSEQELMSPEAIKSFELLPITKGHRMLGPQEQGLTPAEKIPQQGVVGEKVFAEGDTLYANIKVTSEQAKNDINNGLKELSLGYFCQWVKESGDYKGRHYDFAQKNIRGNHLAIVPLGRMGHEVRVMDALPAGAASYACDSLELAGPFVSALLPAGATAFKVFSLPGQAQDWQESDHPRKKDGKFAPKGQGESGKAEPKAAETNKRKAELKNKIKEPYYDKVYYEKLKGASEKGKQLGPRQQTYFNYVNKALNEYNASIEEEANSIPPEDKASLALREAAYNSDNYKFRKIDKDNFFNYTMVNFNQVKNAPDRDPDYVSKSGSKYWYEDDGVYRQANHWGEGVASCDWFINGNITDYANFANTLEKDIVGFAKWNDFTNTANMTIREQRDIFKNAEAKLKNNPKNIEKQTRILESKQKVREKAIELTKDKEPLVDIKDDEFVGKDITAKRKAAKKYYETNLKGKPFTNENSGQTIICGDVGKSFSQSGYEDKINSFKYLPTILEKSEYLGKNKDSENRPDIKFYHYYACKINSTQGKQILILSVRELKDGSFYYNHHITQEQRFELPALQSGTQTSAKDSIDNNSEKINIHYWGIFPDTKESEVKAMENLNKTNGQGGKAEGQDASPEKEEAKMDKREVIREIMAVSARPVSEFKGGEEEKVDTISKLAEKLAYNPSETDANDEDPKEGDGKETVKEDVKDACAKDDKSKAEAEEGKKEDDPKAAMDAMEARIAANFAKKASLYEKISPFIGTFDHNPMSFTQMAKYACDKLGIKGIAEDGAETALIGYLAGAKKQAVVREEKDAACDASPVSDPAFKKYLEEAQ